MSTIRLRFCSTMIFLSGPLSREIYGSFTNQRCLHNNKQNTGRKIPQNALLKREPRSRWVVWLRVYRPLRAGLFRVAAAPAQQASDKTEATWKLLFRPRLSSSDSESESAARSSCWLPPAFGSTSNTTADKTHDNTYHSNDGNVWRRTV